MTGAKRELTLSMINEITTRINSVEDIHELLTVIMDTARDLLYSEASSLLLYDNQTDELIFDIARGERGKLLARKRISPGQGIAGICARDRVDIVVNDARNDSRIARAFDEELNFVTRKLLAVPMVGQEDLVGVLEVLNPIDDRDYSRKDIRLMNYLASMAALAIHNRRLYQDIQERAEELECVYDISQRLSTAENLEESLDLVVSSIDEVLGVERISIIFQEEEHEEDELIRLRGFSVEDGDERIDPHKGIAGVVMRTGDPLLVQDIEKELNLKPVRPDSYKTKSFVSVPIKRAGLVVGLLSAADKKDGRVFNYFDLKVLSTIAGQLGDAYGRHLAVQKEIELQGYRKDLETASLIQMNSLPRIPSRIAGLEIGCRYEASREVSGDFYDLIYHSDDRLSLVIADVAGKGVPAALFMEYSKTLLAGQIARSLDPVTTHLHVNQEICARSEMGLFVTVMIVQLEREMYRMRIASAGHNRQLLYRREFGKLEILSTKGPPLGVMEGAEYLEKVVEYSPGDLLLLFTDGITEANNRRYDEFTEERFFELVEKHGQDASPAEMINIIFAEVNRFRDGMEASDDSTMMVVRL